MKNLSVCIAFLLAAVVSSAQSLTKYENLVSVQEQMETLTYLSDEMTAGRASGSSGAQIASRFISSRFKDIGLKPYEWSYTQSFRYDDTTVVRNVIGYLPAAKPTDEAVIIGAHYDHLGRLGGRTYSGADDNASGVTVLLSLAEMFTEMKRDGKGPGCNLYFVAYDGKELSMCGSDYFVSHLNIPKGKIRCAVNIDIIGSDLVPPHIDKNYIIALGESTLPEEYQGILSSICRKPQYRIDLDLTFYGSKDFTKMYYDMSDQISFSKEKIPAVLFTSGFHDHTYKPTDTAGIINFPLLRKRTLVIFNFIDRLCRERD